MASKLLHAHDILSTEPISCCVITQHCYPIWLYVQYGWCEYTMVMHHIIYHIWSYSVWLV